MKKLFTFGLLTLAVTALLAGCNNNHYAGPVEGPGTNPSSPSNVFISATDAPLPSVLSFQLDVTSFELNSAAGSTQLLNGSSTVDFARYDGLRTFLDLSTLPAGTYTGVTVTVANPVITYLNTGIAPPAPSTLSGTLTNSTLTYTFPSPLTIATGETVGVKFDFEIAKSLQLDSNGQVTGSVNPQFNLEVLTPSTPDAYIDEFVGSVVSMDAASNSFVLQGPHGRQYTVDLTAGTEFENGESISDLTTNSIVEVSGQFARNSATFTADTIGIESQNGYVADGLVTYVNPSSGTASNFNLYVRGELPSSSGLTLGQIANVELNGSERFGIYAWGTPLANFLFNPSAILPGQRVAIGGPVADAGNAQAVTTKRVILKHEGHDGTWVVGSTNASAGTFQFNSDGLAGVLFGLPNAPGPVTVYTSGRTDFEGFNGLGSLSGSSPIAVRVVGLVVKNPATGAPAILARRVVAVQ